MTYFTVRETSKILNIIHLLVTILYCPQRELGWWGGWDRETCIQSANCGVVCDEIFPVTQTVMLLYGTAGCWLPDSVLFSIFSSLPYRPPPHPLSNKIQVVQHHQLSQTFNGKFLSCSSPIYLIFIIYTLHSDSDPTTLHWKGPSITVKQNNVTHLISTFYVVDIFCSTFASEK